MPAIRGDQVTGGFGEFFRGQHGPRASPEELGPVGVEIGGQSVETFDEIVIELNEDLATRHHPMLAV